MPSKSPVLLSPEQRERLGRIPDDLTEAEIARYYTLLRREIDFVKTHHRENWLGVGVQVAVLHFPGIARRDLPAIPLRVVDYLAEQLDCDPVDLDHYAQRINTSDEHLDEICSTFGYHKWTSDFIPPVCRAFLPEVMENDNALVLMQSLLTYLRSQKVLIPAISTVEAIVWHTLRIAERRTFRRLVGVLSEKQGQGLSDLLTPDPKLKGRTRLTWLRRLAKKPSRQSLRHVLLRIIWLDELALPPLPNDLPLNRLHSMARRTARYKAQPLANFNPTKHQALLYCYLVYLRRDLIDQSVDMLGSMKTDLWRRGEKRQEEHLKENAVTANQNLIILTDAIEALLIAERDHIDPFQSVFAVASRETLQEIIETNRKIVRPPDMSIFDLVEERYTAIRASWLKWFVTLIFRPVSGYNAGLSSLRHVILLRKRSLRVTEVAQRLSKKRVVHAPLNHITSERWRKLILKGGLIQPNFYELCAFENVHAGILSGQIAVEGSYRFQSFDSYLLAYRRWQELRDTGRTRLVITGGAETHLEHRLGLMQEKVDRLDAVLGMADCPLVIDDDGTFKLPRLESGVPQPAKQLQKKIDSYFPRTDLPDAILDVDAMTTCLSDFTHLETGEPLMGKDVFVLIATLMAMGMNMSFHRMAMATPFTYKQMAGVAAWYIREETLMTAQARLDTFILRQPISQLWGRGTTVSSDGMRFPVVANASHTQHNPHFLGLKRGKSLYTHTADVWSVLGQQLIPPNDKEALYSIDVMENHPPDFQIVEHYTDTGGYTEHVFCISPILGYYYAPRIRDLLDQNLFSLPGLQVQKPLSALFKGRANTALVTHLWDDMLWSIASIRHGTVSASLLMRKLATYPRRSQLSKAMHEFGKIEKTLFILDYFYDEQLQRRVETGLNKGEAVQAMARATFHGQRGELRTASFQEQFHRTSCMMFLVTLMCAWNTVYLHQIRAYFQQIGEPTDDLLWQHISPARWKHFNMIGHYLFDLNQAHSLHDLRELRFHAFEEDDDHMD